MHKGMHNYTKDEDVGMYVQQDRDGNAVRVGRQTQTEIPYVEEQGLGQGHDILKMELRYGVHGGWD